LVQLSHRQARRGLRLGHEPGTIASAMSIGAQTDVANLLDGRTRKEDISEALRNRKFRIDPVSMKLVMEGEEGYDTALTPDPRKSTFGFAQLLKTS